MYRCFFSLISFVFLIAHHAVLADERGPSQSGPNVGVVTDTTVTGLLLPTSDFFSIGESLRQGSPPEEAEQRDWRAPATAYTFVYRAGPPSLALPVLVRDLVDSWLPRLTSRDPTTVSANKVRDPLAPFPWPAKPTTPLPRVDHIWKAVPVKTLAGTPEALTIDGDVDLGLEVHAGSTKKDRTTNAIKGTASTQVILLPPSIVEQRFERFLRMLGTDEGMGQLSNGQLCMGLATNGAYTINPHTRIITPSGEVAGTVSWMATARDRFTQDPWRIVAFRWYPTVSCEGRHLVGEEKKYAEANRVPLATLTGSLRGDLRLDFLSPRLAASGNYHYRQQLTDPLAKWKQGDVSLKYQLNPSVSLGGSFTHGKTAPSQPITRGLTLEMGVTF